MARAVIDPGDTSRLAALCRSKELRKKVALAMSPGAVTTIVPARETRRGGPKKAAAKGDLDLHRARAFALRLKGK